MMESKMENQKKHIEFHVDINKKTDELNVHIDAENQTVGELFVCCLGIVARIASTIADTTNENEQKVLRDIAVMVLKMAGESLKNLEKEED